MIVQKKGFLIPFLALLFGAFSMAFSLIAYAKRVKAKDVIAKDGYCVYPSSPSPVLGIIAALFLFSEQSVVSFATFCFCCCGLRCSSRCSYITSLLFFIASWVTFVMTFVALVITAILDSNFLAKSYGGNNNVDQCNVGSESLFLGAAFWCIISTVLGLISYAFFVCGAAESNNGSQGRAVDQERSVAMGEPRMQQPPKEQPTSSV